MMNAKLSLHAYLADDVNKVFAKVSKKISKVKMERLVTIKS